MITQDTRITGFDARSWQHLVGLVAPGLVPVPPYAHERHAAATGGLLFVLHADGRVLRALHSRRGAVAVERWTGPEDLARLARTHGARFAMAARAGALEELAERVGGRLHQDDDLWSTLLIVTGAVRELVAEGELHLLPRAGATVPLPPADVLRRAWDYFLPDGRVFLLVTFEHDALDTALIARRAGASLDRVLGPEVLRGLVGPLGGDFRRDYRVIRAAVERELGPLAAGIFTTTSHLAALLRTDTPGAWARSIAARQTIADPLPPWLAVAAGASALRAAAVRSRAALERFDVPVLLDPLARRVRALAELVNDTDLRASLGFDPLELLARFLSRSAPAPRPDPHDREP